MSLSRLFATFENVVSLLHGSACQSTCVGDRFAQNIHDPGLVRCFALLVLLYQAALMQFQMLLVQQFLLQVD